MTIPPQDGDRRIIDSLLEARIQQLESKFENKIDGLDIKVSHQTEATKIGFSHLADMLDARFAAADQKADHNNRESRQSIEFLTEQVKAQALEQSATATKVDFLGVDVKRHGDRLKAIDEELRKLDTDKAEDKEVSAIADNLRWTVRTVAGSIIASAIGLVYALVRIL